MTASFQFEVFSFSVYDEQYPADNNWFATRLPVAVFSMPLRRTADLPI